jgi:hypothetical protein
MSSPQSKYYLAHREEILKKMRERSAKQREARRVMYEENPQLEDKDRCRWRTYYHQRMANKNKEAVESILAVAKEEFKDRIETILKEDKYKNYTPAEINALRSLATA